MRAAGSDNGRHGDFIPSAAGRNKRQRLAAPLVPAALAYTAGVVLDRYAAVPFAASLLLTLGGMFGSLVAGLKGRTRLPLAFLALAATAFVAPDHHYRRDVYPADDMGKIATAEPRPAQLRGVLDEEPQHTPALPDPLRSIEAGDSTAAILRATALHRGDDWIAVSGRVHLMIAGPSLDLHAGDEMEVARSAVAGPRPGQSGRGRRLRDVARPGRPLPVDDEDRGGSDAAGGRGWPASFSGWTAVVRGWGRRALADALPAETGRHGGGPGARGNIPP